MIFWLINYLFGLISINYLFRFNIKGNGIRYYNFDIVKCFEFSILLLLQENHIATQIWNLVCLPHIMVFVYIFVVYISFECMCIYKYWEFCFINLRIVNYFIDFDNYAFTTKSRSMLDNTSKLWKSIEIKYFFFFLKKKILTSKMSIYSLLDFFFQSQ